MEVATRNLIQEVEVYHLDEETGRLHKTHGEGESHALGEGPVGRAWADGIPAIERWDSGWVTVAVPCLRGDDCRGVVTFGGEAGDDLFGAFEVWGRNDRGELGLTDSWFANLDRLEQISQYVKFPVRAGLPGRVWDDRFPRVLGALQDSKHFIRVAAARTEQLCSALGVPFMRKPPELDAVLLILNTKSTPIAGVLEVWSRDLETKQLKIISADYGPYTDLAAASRSVTLRRGEAIAGRVYEDASPWLTHDLLGVEFPRGDRFVEFGFKTGVGLPIFIGSDLVACVNLYL